MMPQKEASEMIRNPILSPINGAQHISCNSLNILFACIYQNRKNVFTLGRDTEHKNGDKSKLVSGIYAKAWVSEEQKRLGLRLSTVVVICRKSIF